MKLTEIATSIKDSHFRELVSFDDRFANQYTVYNFDIMSSHLPDEIQVDDEEMLNVNAYEYSVLGFVWTEDDGREVCRRQYLFARSVADPTVARLFEMEDVDKDFYTKARYAIRDMSSSVYKVPEDIVVTFVYDSLTPHYLYRVAGNDVHIKAGVLSISQKKHSCDDGIANLLQAYFNSLGDIPEGIHKVPFYCRYGFLFPYAK